MQQNNDYFFVVIIIYMVNDIYVTSDKVLMDTYKHIDLPIGTIIMNAGNNTGINSLGTAFLLCDGSLKSGSAYPELYAIIGTKYGTIGTGFFNVPNFVDRFPMGLQDVSGDQISNDPSKNTTARQGGNLQITSNQFLHGHASVTPVVTGVNFLNLEGNIDNESPYVDTALTTNFPASDLVITESPVNNLPVCYTLNYFIYTGKGNIGQV